jgi:hypothetical protein
MSIITSSTSRLIRFLLYVWALPASAIGCCIAVSALCLGATWRMVDGVIEVGGGRFASLVGLLPRVMRFDAITFGHIVLGSNHTVIEANRLHEHAHVRQYERWGLLFFTLYLGSSLAQLLRGRDPHHQNYFERQAYQHAKSAMADTYHGCY